MFYNFLHSKIKWCWFPGEPLPSWLATYKVRGNSTTIPLDSTISWSSSCTCFHLLNIIINNWLTLLSKLLKVGFYKTNFVSLIVVFYKYGHKSLKITWSGIIIGNVSHTTPGKITIRAVWGNIGSWFSVCNIILTQLDEIWWTTSTFFEWKTT